jgi:hypothetical protein
MSLLRMTNYTWDCMLYTKNLGTRDALETSVRIFTDVHVHHSGTSLVSVFKNVAQFECHLHIKKFQ